MKARDLFVLERDLNNAYGGTSEERDHRSWNDLSKEEKEEYYKEARSELS